MPFAGSFSYLNTTVYGLKINANLDLRIENIQGAPGAARVYFTNTAVNFQPIFYKLKFILNYTINYFVIYRQQPINTSNPVPPPPQFGIVDSLGNNLVPILLVNGMACYLISESRGYTMSYRGQVIFTLRTQIQQCTIISPELNYFTIP